VIGSFICRGFNASRIIIGVPSKILINQWKEKIENILPNHKILVFDSNHDIKDTASLEGNKLVVIITYQSCHKIKGVFDMKIGDECHHLVGENKTEKGFKYFHTIESKKTLFLTATKKIVVQKDGHKEICSMGNSSIFGDVIYENNLRWAIENKLITDYSLVCLKNNEETIQEIMRNCKIDDGNIELFLSAFISLKSLVKYEGLSHILIYANNTKNSEKIIEYIDIILENKLM
jgi:predicted helicase